MRNLICGSKKQKCDEVFDSLQEDAKLLRVMSSRCAHDPSARGAHGATDRNVRYLDKDVLVSTSADVLLPFMAFSNSLKCVEAMRIPVTFCASQHPGRSS